MKGTNILIADKDAQTAQQVWDMLSADVKSLESCLAPDVVIGIVERRSEPGSEMPPVDGVIIAHTFERYGDGLEIAKQLDALYNVRIIVAVENGQKVDRYPTIQKPELLKENGVQKILEQIEEGFEYYG